MNENIEFSAYVDYASMGRRGGEIVITLHSSDPSALDLLAVTLSESVDCTHDDPAIWFKFKATRGAA